MYFLGKALLSVVMFVLGVVVVYYASASLLSGISSVAMWDFLVFKESMVLSVKPTNVLSGFIRTLSLFVALGGGAASVKYIWE